MASSSKEEQSLIDDTTSGPTTTAPIDPVDPVVDSDDVDDVDDVDAAVEDNASDGADGDGELTTAQRFKQWRASRPFIPGLLMMISGFVIAAPAYITVEVSDILVMISTISGVSTLLIGVVLFMFGLGCWLQPATAVYLGVLSIIVAVIALPTSNLGGFVVGSLFGIVGGALALGWEPGDKEPQDANAKKGRKQRRHKKAKHARTSTEHTANGTDGQGSEEDDSFDPFANDAFDEPDTTRTSEDPTPRGGSTKLGGAGSTLQSLVAIAAASSLVGLALVDTHAVSAQERTQQLAQPASAIQLPELPAPDIKLPELPQIQVPSVPIQPPTLPAPPSVAVPSLKPGAPTGTSASSSTPKPTSPVPPPPGSGAPAGPLPPATMPSTVTADKVTLTGNVHATLDYVNVGGTPTRALILTGDRLVGRNLALQIPGFGGGGKLTTGNVDTKVSDGPVRIVATGLTATPAVRDLRTIPVTVDLTGDINSVLDQLGVPEKHPVPNVEVPDMLMKEISLTAVNMQMVSLYGTNFHAPSVHLTVP